LRASDGDGADVITQDLFDFADGLHGAWISGYNQAHAQGLLSEQELAKGPAASGIILGGAADLREKSAKLTDRADSLIKKLRERVNASNLFVSADLPEPLSLIRSPRLSDFYLVSDIARRVPSAMIAARSSKRVQFDKNLLDQTVVPLLITGPAGYGKTTFCRWNALRDLEALESKRVQRPYRCTSSFTS
jgi:hypothetical protein